MIACILKEESLSKLCFRFWTSCSCWMSHLRYPHYVQLVAMA